MLRQEAFEAGLETGQFQRATNKAGREVIWNLICHVFLLEGCVYTCVTTLLGNCRYTIASSALLFQAYFSSTFTFVASLLSQVLLLLCRSYFCNCNLLAQFPAKSLKTQLAISRHIMTKAGGQLSKRHLAKRARTQTLTKVQRRPRLLQWRKETTKVSR